MYLYIYINSLYIVDTKRYKKYCFTNHTKQKGTKVPENYMTENTKKQQNFLYSNRKLMVQ